MNTSQLNNSQIIDKHLLVDKQTKEVSKLRAGIYTKVTDFIAKQLKTPQYLIMFVSDKCWMKCSHCWFNEDWKENNLTEEILTFDDYKKIAASIDKLHFLSVTGGEAFMRHDLVEILTMMIKDANVSRYQIPTSGFVTDLIVKKAEALLKNNPNIPFRVDVSLDGTEEIHNEIRKVKNGYSHAVDTIKALTKLKERYAYFDVGVITTVSSKNSHCLETLSKEVEVFHPNGEWMINITRGNVRDNAAQSIVVEDYERAEKLIQERIASGQYKGHSGHRGAKMLSAKNAVRRQVIAEIVKGYRKGGGCAAGSIGGVLYGDGKVEFCEMLEEPLGNIRDYGMDLRMAWNSEKAKELRAQIQHKGCQCTQECFLSVSMLLQPDTWPKMLKERLKLGLF